VIAFFETYHQSRIKIYNMCNDDFVNTKVLSLANGNIKVAYFPFMDHNPGPIVHIFRLVLDQTLYLASDPESMVAVHCKAGKGRTGLAICAYLIFQQAVTHSSQAVQMFNTRRTTNAKGLQIAS